jgi:serpin B
MNLAMKNVKKLCVALTCSCLLLTASTCAGQTEDTYMAPNNDGSTQPANDPQTKALATKSNAFAADLYGQLAGTDGNLFFSPSSIHIAMTMAYFGSAGQTKDQLGKVLHLGGVDENVENQYSALMEQLNNPATVDDKPAFALKLANAMWVQQDKPVGKKYSQLLDTYFNAELNKVDFAKSDAARKTINDWVADKTQNKITDLVTPGAIDANTRLILTNAIYFKSDWANTFDKHFTTDDIFKSTGTTASVPMMHKVRNFGYLENDDFQALEIPYKQNALSMVVFLPRTDDGLAKFEKSINPKQLEQWLGQLKDERVNVTLPKFKFDSSFSLAQCLKAMGAGDAFDSKLANFAEITRAEPLYIGAVLHKAMVAVDENGTEAAAATAVIFMTTAARMEPAKPKVFKADHPFVFLIKHNDTGEILFMGRVANPANQK